MPSTRSPARRVLARLGPVNAAGSAGVVLAGTAWGTGHAVVALALAGVLGLGPAINAVRLLALPRRHAQLLEFVDSWEHLTGTEFGRGHRSDDVARTVYRQWRRAVRDGEAVGALGYLHRRAAA